MADKKFSGIIIPMLLFGLFAFAFLIGTKYMYTANASANDPFVDTGLGTYLGSLQGNLSGAYSSANSTETAIGTSPVTANSRNGLVIDAVGGVWKTMKAIPVIIYSVTAEYVFNTLFGSPEYAIVFGVVASIFLLIISIAVIRLVFQGDGG